MNHIDGAKYQGEPALAIWCADLDSFVDFGGNPVPDFVPEALDEESPVKKYFVHRYDVVRVKVAVEARSQQEAMQKADDYLATNHPIRNCYHSVGDDEKIAQHYGFPTWLHYEEPGQEVTGYLVDEFGDQNYERSQEYTPDHEPITLLSHWDEDPEYPVEDWRFEVENDDTRQGYTEWVRGQRNILRSM